MVSILVPVYDASQYLRECVASLTGQTYTDLQIVLINDGSTDDSWDILKDLAQQDKRLEVYSQPNSGVAATRNRLLEKANGDFVLFVDSDDWIELNTVEVLVEEQKRLDCDMVVFNQPEDAVWSREKAVYEFLRHKKLRGMLWNKLIRRKLFERLSFDESVSYGEDALMVWYVLQHVDKVRLINKMLYHYRENENSLSRQSFDGKKFTAYTTWDNICGDTAEWWPQYNDVARARFACEMTLVLKDAALCGYPRTSSVKLMQEEVRRYSHLIRKTGISTNKMRVFAWLSSHCYWLACRLKGLY
jgi:glycosyltransferase involved in cell wall biosynthesis